MSVLDLSNVPPITLPGTQCLHWSNIIIPVGILFKAMSLTNSVLQRCNSTDFYSENKKAQATPPSNVEILAYGVQALVIACDLFTIVGFFYGEYDSRLYNAQMTLQVLSTGLLIWGSPSSSIKTGTAIMRCCSLFRVFIEKQMIFSPCVVKVATYEGYHIVQPQDLRIYCVWFGALAVEVLTTMIWNSHVRSTRT